MNAFRHSLILAVIAFSFCTSPAGYAAAPIVDGMTWPDPQTWPQPEDSRFIAAKELALTVYRDELSRAPAAQVTCEKGTRTCLYLFTPCEEVWVKRVNEKRGYIAIDVKGLGEYKAVGGEWWMLLAPTRAACEAALKDPAHAEISFVPWTAPAPNPIAGLKVWNACRSPAGR